MSQSKSQPVTIQLGSLTRWLLLLPVLLVLLGAWFAVRWYVGNTIAEYAPGAAEGGIEMARMAVRWAPEDPLTHWRLGSLEDKNFSAQNLAAAVYEYQTAVALSPNDYRYWTELGRALEATGDRENGEKALLRAVALAPAYSHPRWYLGNLILREGKFEEAFIQLGRAAESDAQMRPQVFDLAMRVFDGDVDQVAKVACPSALARMQFAIHLAGAQRFNDAIRMWNMVPAPDRRAQPALSVELEQSLMRAKQFRAALAIMREHEPDANLPASGQIWNGDFESELTRSNADIFSWVVKSAPAAQIAIESPGHTGQSSLRIIFKASSTLNAIQLSQTLAVEPGAQYRLTYYQRTAGLVTASTPVLTISDAVSGAVLATSKPLPNGTTDWQPVTLDFTTDSSHDGIIVGFSRAPCEEGQICPIFGSVWYDDFNLQRTGGAGSGRRDAAGSKR